MKLGSGYTGLYYAIMHYFYVFEFFHNKKIFFKDTILNTISHLFLNLNRQETGDRNATIPCASLVGMGFVKTGVQRR